MRMMKNCLLIISASVILAACATANKQQGYENRQEIAEMVNNAVNNRDFTIKVQTAFPMRGRAIPLTADFDLAVKGDSVVSCLPYFGRGYYIPYGGGDGLNFTDVMRNFKVTQRKDDMKSIEFMVKNSEDSYSFYIDVFDNGRATINVVPQQRESISFKGEMEPKK